MALTRTIYPNATKLMSNSRRTILGRHMRSILADFCIINDRWAKDKTTRDNNLFLLKCSWADLLDSVSENELKVLSTCDLFHTINRLLEFNPYE